MVGWKTPSDIEKNTVYIHGAAHTNFNLVLNDAVRKIIDMQHFLKHFNKLTIIGA